jgi:hypothetical protein
MNFQENRTARGKLGDRWFARHVGRISLIIVGSREEESCQRRKISADDGRYILMKW